GAEDALAEPDRVIPAASSWRTPSCVVVAELLVGPWRDTFRKIGAIGLLSRHTVAHLGHRQHLGSGLFRGQGQRGCSALLGEASKLLRLSAHHGLPPHLVSYRSQPNEHLGVPVTNQDFPLSRSARLASSS